MNLIIEEKLKLNQTPICFFKEGIFLKVFNESFYLIQQQFKINLKPQVRFIKKINQTIIIGGFPLGSIETKFPNATQTSFGYQLLGDYDLSGYAAWFANCCKHDEQKNDPKSSSNKMLTDQQLAFLQLWQPNLYSPIIDTAFIKELKDYFLANDDH